MGMPNKKDDSSPDDKRSRFKLLEFKPEPFKEDMPQEIFEFINLLKKKAEQGKLTSVILNMSFEDDVDEEGNVKEDSPEAEQFFFWNSSYNPKEMLGSVELLKSQILEFAYSMMDVPEPE